MKKTAIFFVFVICGISIFNYIPVFQGYYQKFYGSASISLGVFAALGIDGAIYFIASFHSRIKSKFTAYTALTLVWFAACFYHYEFYVANGTSNVKLYVSSIIWPSLTTLLSWISRSDETSVNNEMSDDDKLLNEILARDAKASVINTSVAKTSERRSENQSERASDETKIITSERSTKRATRKRESRVYPYTCDCGKTIMNRYVYSAHIGSCEANGQKETV
jgi:hypothetical protein